MVKAVTLAEDVYTPPNGSADPERCLIIAYVSKFLCDQNICDEFLKISHGLFGFRTNWRSLAKAFSERAKIKVITIN